jgi:hypothetical protein
MYVRVSYKNVNIMLRTAFTEKYSIGICVKIFLQSMGGYCRNRVGIGLYYQPGRLQRLVESIPGLLKRLKMPFSDLNSLKILDLDLDVRWDQYNYFYFFDFFYSYCQATLLEVLRVGCTAPGKYFIF